MTDVGTCAQTRPSRSRRLGKGHSADQGLHCDPAVAIRSCGAQVSGGRAGRRLTLFLLTAELGHSRRRDREELCSSLHTCHRKWRKEPPAGQMDTHQRGTPQPPLPTGAVPTWNPSSFASLIAAAEPWKENSSEGWKTEG